MVKKRVFVFVFIALLFSISFALAAENSTNATLTGFEKSYSCLKEKIDSTGYSSMTVEELAFSLLALGYDKDRQNALKSEIESRADSSEEGKACWPSGACTLKETSMVLLAYNHIGADTSKIKSWMQNQTAVASDLVWYLQVNADEKADCTLTYDNSSKKITLNEDKTLSGSPGACFRFAQNNYWLEIVSSCYDKEIEITCNKDFLTAWLYRGKNQNTYYVSDLTNQAATGGKLTEKVQSLCFRQAGACNYEGSLWASFALNKENSKDTKIYLPYLMTFASSNSRALPSAFLYSLTGFDEYFSELSALQNSLGYWQTSDSSKRYYDTAAALMSLYGKSTEQAQLAVDYLLTPNVQQDGCWQNSIRDTAFVLYSASPKPASKGTSTIVERTSCTSISGYSCIPSEECTEEINGSVLDNFYCFGGAVCCDKKSEEPSCSEKDGIVCSSSEDCSGMLTTAKGTSRCCIDGLCEAKVIEVNECEEAGYFCRSSCLDNEDEMQTIECPEFASCCSPRTEEKRSYWWLWLLLILIILVILAIIFRDQLKIWWFKIKGKVSKTPASSPPRAMPPSPPSYPGARRIIPMQPQFRPQPRPFPKETELKSTLDRLKELSK